MKKINNFKELANNIHLNYYSYDKVIYKNTKEKVIITCPIHGDFEQKPEKHLMGRGCRKCGIKRRNENSRKEEVKFIDELKSLESLKNCTFDEVNYKNSKTKVIITCSEHGNFSILPLNLLRGQGCPTCGIIRRSEFNTLSQEEYLKKVKEIHGDLYDYSLVEYVKLQEKIKIICSEHGIFEMTASNHLYCKQNCPKCMLQVSNSEKEIQDFIKSLDIEFETCNRKILNGQELDIYIPSKKLAIEYNGIYFHSEKYGKDKNYHLNKTLECEKQNIQLIHIFEDEWIYKQDIVKSRLRHLLKNTSKSIYARKCIVKELDNEITNNFIEKYHIQGQINTKINLGLYYDDLLVAIMTFSKSRYNKNYNWELVRYCTIDNCLVIGGAGKLLSYFKKNYQGSIISYADRRWSNGNLYKQLGFIELKNSLPNYFYVKGDKRMSRLLFQKHKLKDLLKDFDESLTESENMINNGYNRIWDCGNKVFVMEK